jgi:ribosomal protein S18 acetylase RimI-like enzyme
VRPPTPDDVGDALAVAAAKDVEEFGAPNVDERVLLANWRSPSTALARDVWVAFAEGRPAGYAHVLLYGDSAEIDDNSGVHPAFRGRGIGSHLLELAELRARKSGARSISGTAAAVNPAGMALFEGRGYRLAGGMLRMEIGLLDEPPAADWPTRVVCRALRDGDERPVHALIQDAFAWLANYQETPFERWIEARRERARSERATWLVADSGDQVAGALLAFDHWILELAVAPSWRRRGIGLALLRTSFGELRRRGFKRAGLEVEAENPTGAVQLYERAGMHETRHYNIYERALA